MAELGDLFGSGGGASSEVKVQDEMMDFEYVRTCKDANLLKAILHRLQTGEDGHYPDLVRAVQKRILEVVPAKERARMERMTKTATIEEVSQAEKDILEWTSSITGRDSNLSKTSASKEIFDSAPASQAPVRGEARVMNADPISKPNTSTSISSDLLSSNSDKKRSQRISGYDFKAWEKFDADTVISSMDTQEENRKSDVRQAKETFQSESSSSAARRKQHHLNMMEKFRAESGWSALSDTSKALKAGEFSSYSLFLHRFTN